VGADENQLAPPLAAARHRLGQRGNHSLAAGIAPREGRSGGEDLDMRGVYDHVICAGVASRSPRRGVLARSRSIRAALFESGLSPV